jgi:hypothetical protein
MTRTERVLLVTRDSDGLLLQTPIQRIGVMDIEALIVEKLAEAHEQFSSNTIG